MVNARGFVWMDEQKAEHPDRLWGVADEPRPLAVQMWDNDPETLAKVGVRLAQDPVPEQRRAVISAGARRPDGRSWL